MDRIVYTAIKGYYNALGKLGYFKYDDVFKLLVLCFYKNYVYSDFRGIISKEDYLEIEQALSCLYGTNCLIPYPDYLKMGKLHLGEITELAHRVKILEETDVLKSEDLGQELAGSDIMIVTEEE